MESSVDRSTRPPRTGRTRGWLPAVVAAVVSAAGLWILEVLADVAPFAGVRADFEHGAGGLWAGLIGGRITFFGSDNNALFDDTGSTIRVLVSTAAVLVIAYVVTWLGTVGLAARAVLPLFLSGWTAAVLAGAGGFVASTADVAIRSGSGSTFLDGLGAAIEVGASYGVFYGWIPALLAALFWSATPARRHEVELEPTADTEPDTGETDLRKILGEERLHG